jgi:hypothetical protein
LRLSNSISTHPDSADGCGSEDFQAFRRIFSQMPQTVAIREFPKTPLGQSLRRIGARGNRLLLWVDAVEKVLLIIDES